MCTGDHFPSLSLRPADYSRPMTASSPASMLALYRFHTLLCRLSATFSVASRCSDGFYAFCFRPLVEDMMSDEEVIVERMVLLTRNAIQGRFQNSIGAQQRVGGAGAGAGSALTIQVTPEGFPMVPTPAALDKLTKDDLERLYHTYITHHYWLASRDTERQAPFTRISLKQSEFIQAKYIPRGVTLNDPRMMKREAMLQFFHHIAARQESHGIQDVFRFKAILSSRKKGSLLEAKYFDTEAKQQPAPAPAPRRKKKAPKAQADNWDKDPVILVEPEPESVPSLTLDPAYNFDRPLDLDPSLDPALDCQPPSPSLFMHMIASLNKVVSPVPDDPASGTAVNPWQQFIDVFNLASNWAPATESQPAQSGHIPTAGPMTVMSATTPALNITHQMDPISEPGHLEGSPRHRVRNAETLAREEAQKYGATGKRRR
ncbi:hypothetical protein BYT27DRAFT_7257398 [Phlegmacium glaucopus]|nr:hypothetical protein BYT27DRAFT_7257398 [Phlegmacium glaucopus]